MAFGLGLRKSRMTQVPRNVSETFVFGWLYEGLFKRNLSETLYKPFTLVLVSAKEQPQKVFIEKYSNSNM